LTRSSKSLRGKITYTSPSRGTVVRICRISVVILVVVTIVGRGGDGDRRESGQDDPDVTVDAARYLPGVYAAVEMTWLVK